METASAVTHRGALNIYSPTWRGKLLRGMLHTLIVFLVLLVWVATHKW